MNAALYKVHGMMSVLSSTVLLVTALLLASDVAIAHARGHKCRHNPQKPTTGVYIEGSDKPVREKRFLTRIESFAQIRVNIQYDASVYKLSPGNSSRLKDKVIPAILDFVKSFNVTPLTGPILLDRKCTVNDSETMSVRPIKQCTYECDEETKCGETVIPENHLKRCVECNGTEECNDREGSENGAGIPDVDLVVYVSATQSSTCSDSSGDSKTLAHAGPCQMESVYDRPIAGSINFCPEEFSTASDEENIETGIHEMIHALVFTPFLFLYFRDIHGTPIVERDEYGRVGPFGTWVGAQNIFDVLTYNDWLTRTGPVSHNVIIVVTPKVVEEARVHFGCDNITGVELENQGGEGTAVSHWEHRVLGDEIMAGSSYPYSKAIISRITLALFEDSGWYRSNYSYAGHLPWGRQRGCNIAHASCAAHIKDQQTRREALSPFCNDLISDYNQKYTCTVDRDRFAECSKSVLSKTIPPVFQYFNDSGAEYEPRIGSYFRLTDYCPFPIAINDTRSCSDESFQRADNIAGEHYGYYSRCIEHGQTKFTRTNINDGNVSYYEELPVGCYKYSCELSGVHIHFLGSRYLCNCEGEELIINTTIKDYHYEGSLICPSCISLCYDQIDKCLGAEKRPACPYQVTTAVPVLPELEDVRVSCYQVTWRNTLDVPCDSIAGYDIRMYDSATKKSVTRRLDPYGTYYNFHPVDDIEFTMVATSSAQVRVVSKDLLGIYSPLKPLGCKPSVRFELQGKIFPNNSVVSISKIGTGEDALVCKTDKEDCCGTIPNRAGEFYYPNGVKVPIRSRGHHLYRDRGEQQIRLNRRIEFNGENSVTGVYKCEIPDTSGVFVELYITITA